MLYFITGNAGKFREIQEVIPTIKQLNLELEEIQSLDSRIVIEHKLLQAASQHKGAFIVEDTSLAFACLNGLPGTQIKWFEERLGNTGLVDLINRYDDHSVVAQTTIGYRDETGDIHYFTGESQGKIVPPRGDLSPFGWNPIFQPKGESRTYAEMTPEEKNRTSMRGIATRKLRDFLTSTNT